MVWRVLKSSAFSSGFFLDHQIKILSIDFSIKYVILYNGKEYRKGENGHRFSIYEILVPHFLMLVIQRELVGATLHRPVINSNIYLAKERAGRS